MLARRRCCSVSNLSVLLWVDWQRSIHKLWLWCRKVCTMVGIHSEVPRKLHYLWCSSLVAVVIGIRMGSVSLLLVSIMDWLSVWLRETYVGFWVYCTCTLQRLSGNGVHGTMALCTVHTRHTMWWWLGELGTCEIGGLVSEEQRVDTDASIVSLSILFMILGVAWYESSQ